MEIGAELEIYEKMFGINLPEDEKVAMTAQLEQIVGYMDVLAKLDTSDVEPMRKLVTSFNSYAVSILAM